MLDLIEAKRSALVELCRKHRVKRLDAFGSAANGTFVPGSSDLDFLVDFETMEPIAYKRAYFGMLADLEDTFGLPVDLVTVSSLRNPHFIRSIESTRQVVYAG